MDAPEPHSLPDLHDIQAAAERIRDLIHRTPTLSSRSLGELHGGEVSLKAENLQRAGAFKIRGALNALLVARERAQLGPGGVLTYSSGNHGQAVALAARLLGFTATVVVPEDMARVKRAAVEAYGARIIVCGTTSEDRRLGAMRLARETGAHLIPPYDHPDVIAGQGTIALEVLEDVPELEAVVVPIGGGGLIAGVSIAIKMLRPGVQVIGAEPSTSNDTALSLARGKRVTIPPSKTIADGLRALTPGALTFEAIRRHVDQVLCVDDNEIRQAQRLLLNRAKLLTEPSGAISAAVYCRHGAALAARKVALVLSGGNVDLPLFGETPS